MAMATRQSLAWCADMEGIARLFVDPLALGKYETIRIITALAFLTELGD